MRTAGEVGEKEGLAVQSRTKATAASASEYERVPCPCSGCPCSCRVLAGPGGWPRAFRQTCRHRGIISKADAGRSEWKSWFLLIPLFIKRPPK